jgi:vacuolar-type H+-ATPase subunit I/STV1
MFNGPGGAEAKLAVLESKLSIYEDLSREMLSKLEAAVDKISDGHSKIAMILAKHEEKLDQSSRTDDLIIKMVEEIRGENKEDQQELEERIEKIENRIEELFKTKWLVFGMAGLIAFAITAIGTFYPIVSDQMTTIRIEERRENIQK